MYLFYLASKTHVHRLGGSFGLVVMGEDWSRGLEFESKHQILDE